MEFFRISVNSGTDKVCLLSLALCGASSTSHHSLVHISGGSDGGHSLHNRFYGALSRLGATVSNVRTGKTVTPFSYATNAFVLPGPLGAIQEMNARLIALPFGSLETRPRRVNPDT